MRVTDLLSGAVAEGSPVRFGRGASDTPVDLALSADQGLSRLAGVITATPDGILVTSHQRSQSGFLEILTPGGHIRARLSQGTSFVSKDRELHVRLLVSAGPRLDLHVMGDPSSSDGTPPIKAPQLVMTQIRFAEQTVLNPEVGKEWQTVVAIACAGARFGGGDGAIPKFAWVQYQCAAWFGMPQLSPHWLSDRYDAALTALHMPISGAGDKLTRIIPAVLAGRMIDDALLATVFRRLR